MTGAASAPISTTQRQPSIPSGVVGTSVKARKETTGTQTEADRLTDRRRPCPQNPLRRELAQVRADGHDLDAEADAGNEAARD